MAKVSSSQGEDRTVLLVAPHVYGQWCTEGHWKAYRWLRWAGRKLGSTIANGGARIILAAPPRHCKSGLASRWTPLWFLERWSNRRVILASYGDELAVDVGRDVRNEAATNPRVLVELREDSKAAARWNTPQGGGMTCVGVGGPLTGRGGDLIIVDDPIKNWEEAHSHTAREKLINWFQSVLYTRAEPGASIVIVQTRWHEEDLAGWLLANHGDRWSSLRLPAVAEPGDPLGRAVGEPLLPERYSTEVLEQIHVAVGDAVWAAVYQQAPQPVTEWRVYTHFDPGRNLDSTLTLDDYSIPLSLSLDFNIDPGMHAVIGQYDERRDMLTAVHEVHGPRMNVLDCMDRVAAIIRAASPTGVFHWPELHVFGDPSGRSEWAGTSESSYVLVQRKLAEHGLIGRSRVRVPRGAPPVKFRVDSFNDALRDVLGGVHYLVHPRCLRLVTDLRELPGDSQGLPMKNRRALSHASDAEGYRIAVLRPLMALSQPGRVSFSVPGA